ncbi:MAG: UxaA family hydrolase [Candidatus Velthaea sp.]
MPLSTDGAALRLKDDDNVAVCLRAVPAGGRLRFGDISVDAVADIPAGHKIALRPIACGELVLKYGQSIGKASAPIAAGEHVHVHNVESIRGRGDLAEAAS